MTDSKEEYLRNCSKSLIGTRMKSSYNSLTQENGNTREDGELQILMGNSGIGEVESLMQQ